MQYGEQVESPFAQSSEVVPALSEIGEQADSVGTGAGECCSES